MKHMSVQTLQQKFLSVIATVFAKAKYKTVCCMPATYGQHASWAARFYEYSLDLHLVQQHNLLYIHQSYSSTVASSHCSSSCLTVPKEEDLCIFFHKFLEYHAFLNETKQLVPPHASVLNFWYIWNSRTLYRFCFSIVGMQTHIRCSYIIAECFLLALSCFVRP